MKTIIVLLTLSLATGCFAQSSDSTSTDKPIECAFPQGVCPDGDVYEEHEQFNDGKGCTVVSATCYPAGTPRDRVPADCFTKVSLACDEDPSE